MSGESDVYRMWADVFWLAKWVFGAWAAHLAIRVDLHKAAYWAVVVVACALVQAYFVSEEIVADERDVHCEGDHQ